MRPVHVTGHPFGSHWHAILIIFPLYVNGFWLFLSEHIVLIPADAMIRLWAAVGWACTRDARLNIRRSLRLLHALYDDDYRVQMSWLGRTITRSTKEPDWVVGVEVRAMQAALATTLRGSVSSLAVPRKTRLLIRWTRCQNAAAMSPIGQRHRHEPRPAKTDRRFGPIGAGRCAVADCDRRCQFARRINKCQS